MLNAARCHLRFKEGPSPTAWANGARRASCWAHKQSTLARLHRRPSRNRCTAGPGGRICLLRVTAGAPGHLVLVGHLLAQGDKVIVRSGALPLPPAEAVLRSLAVIVDGWQ
eukprot:scaffold26690_cov112-Isochrysis_galbana.AAC.2